MAKVSRRPRKIEDIKSRLELIDQYINSESIDVLVSLQLRQERKDLKDRYGL